MAAARHPPLGCLGRHRAGHTPQLRQATFRQDLIGQVPWEGPTALQARQFAVDVEAEVPTAAGTRLEDKHASTL